MTNCRNQTVIGVMVFIMLFFNTTTLACTCSKKIPSLYKDFKRTEYIFIGTVTNTTTTWRNDDTEASLDVQFHVDEFFKPPALTSNNRSITIYTPKDRSGCGLKMKSNERWQIWAIYTTMFSEDDNTRRWLAAHSCGRSTKIYNRNINHLRRWSNIISAKKDSHVE
jgi:hypothetical protein